MVSLKRIERNLTLREYEFVRDAAMQAKSMDPIRLAAIFYHLGIVTGREQEEARRRHVAESKPTQAFRKPTETEKEPVESTADAEPTEAPTTEAEVSINE